MSEHDWKFNVILVLAIVGLMLYCHSHGIVGTDWTDSLQDR